MSKFRKKPVVIEAIQWKGNSLRDAAALLCALEVSNAPVINHRGSMLIGTLEGVHEARVGDWVIKGVHGEIYPCKPDIFEKTYESAENE